MHETGMPGALPAAGLPVGELVEPVEPIEAPARVSHTGRYVTLSPLDAQAELAELYQSSHGDEDRMQIWTYMPYGPFADRDAMLAWLISCEASADPLFLAVTDHQSGRRAGMVSFLNIVPAMRRVELGHIWYAPAVQRSKANTEAVYLLLCEAFDRLRYRRVEWKCDSLNARSRAAALRLGFSFEGVFRQHMIVKGRNRHTAWFALLDGEWSRVKVNMERWLYSDEQGLSLRRLNAGLVGRSLI